MTAHSTGGKFTPLIQTTVQRLGANSEEERAKGQVDLFHAVLTVCTQRDTQEDAVKEQTGLTSDPVRFVHNCGQLKR